MSRRTLDDTKVEGASLSLGAQKKSNERYRALLGRSEMGTIIPLVILMVVVAFINSNFFNINNILDVLRAASFSFMIAVPLTFLIAGGGIDLSIGAATSLGGVICAFCLKAGVPIPLAILITMIMGGLLGFLNGLIVEGGKLPAFLATLATQYVLNGIILVITEGVAVSGSGFTAEFKLIGQFKAFGLVPMPVIYAFIIGVIGHIILANTKAGRNVLAIGGNSETSRLAGLNIIKHRIVLFMATSIMATLSGVVIASRFAAAQPGAGTGTDLIILAAVIIGGTSFYGGTATVIGSALGCVLLSTIQNILIVIGVSIFWQNFVFGLILLISLFVDKYRRQINNKI